MTKAQKPPRYDPNRGIMAQVAMAANKDERMALIRQYQEHLRREQQRQWFWSLPPERRAEELAQIREERRANKRA